MPRFIVQYLLADCRKNEAGISRDLSRMVRELIGPIAAFRLSVAVKALPRTRSGKICRKSIADLAKDKPIKVICFNVFLNFIRNYRYFRIWQQ